MTETTLRTFTFADMLGSIGVPLYSTGIYVEVDQNFLSDPVLTLLTNPVPGSDIVCINGIAQPSGPFDSYTIEGRMITFNPEALLRLGDKILVKYLRS